MSLRGMHRAWDEVVIAARIAWFALALAGGDANAQGPLVVTAVVRVPVAAQGRIGPIGSVVAVNDTELAILGDVQRVLAVVRSTDGSVVLRRDLNGDGWALGDPVTMVGFGGGVVALIDRSPPRVVRAVVGGGQAKLISTRNTQLLASTGACSKGRRLIVAALTDPVRASFLLHEVADDGRRVRSFVSQDDRAAGFMRSLYEVLIVACDSDNDRVYVGSRFHGQVKSIDLGSGRELWSWRAPNFLAIRLENPDSVTLVPGAPPGGAWNEIAALHTVSDRYLVVQVSRGARGRFGSEVVRTLVLDRNTGAFAGELPGLRRIVGATRTALYAISGATRDTLWRIDLAIRR